MTDTVDTAQENTLFDPNVRTPEMEMAETGGEVPAAADLDLADINPVNPHLFKEDRWQDHFARLLAQCEFGGSAGQFSLGHV